MKKTTKKIIAREFLILIGTALLFFIVFFIWLWLIERNQNKENEFEKQLTELTESKKVPHRLRVYYFIKKEMDETLNNPKEFISELKKLPVITEKYNYLKNDDRIDKSFSSFRDSILADNKSEKHLIKTQEIEKNIQNTKKSFFNKSIYDDEIFGLGIILFSVLFLLRYLIYGIKWSFKQLKDNE